MCLYLGGLYIHLINGYSFGFNSLIVILATPLTSPLRHMRIVGTISNKNEAEEIELIAKNAFIGYKFRCLNDKK